jgi:hypothetical protein
VSSAKTLGSWNEAEAVVEVAASPSPVSSCSEWLAAEASLCAREGVRGQSHPAPTARVTAAARTSCCRLLLVLALGSGAAAAGASGGCSGLGAWVERGAGEGVGRSAASCSRAYRYPTPTRLLLNVQESSPASERSEAGGILRPR